MIVENNVILSNSINYLTLNISELRYAILDKSWRRKTPEKDTFNRLYCIKEGSAYLECGGKVVLMEAGNVYVVPAEVPCRYWCEDHMEKLYMHFSMMRYDNRDLLDGVSECLVLENRADEIEEMIRQWRNADYFSMVYLRTQVYRYICEAMKQRGVDTWKNEAYSLLVKRAIEYIDKHLTSGLSASTISAELFVSESRLRKIFRAEVGIAIGKYINDRIMSAAELQLRYSDSSVKDISESLGFCDQFYFSRMFSKQYGLSPAAYRKMAQG